MARTDTLGNFLTDVADAIREKGGTSDPIQASDFDTAIANLPSGSATPTSVAELNTLIETAMQAYTDYALVVPGLYETDTTEVTTIYTPNADYQYYAIIKRNNGYYCIIWATTNYLFINTQYFYKLSWYINSTGSQDPELSHNKVWFKPAYASLGTYYYSPNYSTISECVEKLKSNATTYSTDSGWPRIMADTSERPIPYSNGAIVDGRVNNGDYPYCMPKRVSSNETITTIE